MYVCNLNGKVRKDELRHAMYRPAPEIVSALFLPLIDIGLAGTAYSRRWDGGGGNGGGVCDCDDDAYGVCSLDPSSTLLRRRRGV